jgi:hypothetical protein
MFAGVVEVHHLPPRPEVLRREGPDPAGAIAEDQHVAQDRQARPAASAFPAHNLERSPPRRFAQQAVPKRRRAFPRRDVAGRHEHPVVPAGHQPTSLRASPSGGSAPSRRRFPRAPPRCVHGRRRGPLHLRAGRPLGRFEAAPRAWPARAPSLWRRARRPAAPATPALRRSPSPLPAPRATAAGRRSAGRAGRRPRSDPPDSTRAGSPDSDTRAAPTSRAHRWSSPSAAASSAAGTAARRWGTSPAAGAGPAPACACSA